MTKFTPPLLRNINYYILGKLIYVGDFFYRTTVCLRVRKHPF